MLFDGDTTHKLADERSIPGLEKWFEKVLPSVFGDGGDTTTDTDVGVGGGVEETPTPTPKPSKSKGKKQKKASSTLEGVVSGDAAVQDISFKSLVAASGNRVALFYFTSDGLHDKVLGLGFHIVSSWSYLR
jgi:hypothetical protein